MYHTSLPYSLFRLICQLFDHEDMRYAIFHKFLRRSSIPKFLIEPFRLTLPVQFNLLYPFVFSDFF